MRLHALLLLLPVLVVVQTSSAQQPAAQPPGEGAAASVRSPDVSAGRNVTFRIAAPKASAVSVICECLTLEEAEKIEQQIARLGQRSATDPDMVRLTRALQNVRANQGARALAKDANGVWSLTLNGVAPDYYEYHFKVDDFEMLDPRNPVVKYNSRPNLIESLLEVPGSAPMFYDVKPVPHGKVEMRLYDSKSTASTRRAWVYTPPGYEKSTAKLPVLYLLHGGDGDETVWTTFGKMNNILDNLIAEKNCSRI
jgi:enterochelin esterase family protein